MTILYYDCFSGISGDMNLGAMIDLGVDQSYLQNELKKLPIQGYLLTFSKDQRKGITGTKATVTLLDKKSGHFQPLFPVKKDAQLDRSPMITVKNGKNRSFSEISDIISNSTLSDKVKTLSISMFRTIGMAEAKIHGQDIEDIHFHEVGAIDAIIDIVGAAICFDYLKPDKVIVSPIELGGGMVQCAHGLFPVPAPATIEILQGKPVRLGAVQVETTTPTGAAILVALGNEFSEKKELFIHKTAYGIGQRDNHIPNVLRVCLCDSILASSDQKSTIIECNMDDMNPEFYGYLIEKIFSEGADDVFLQNIMMKKNRPAIKLSVLCDEAITKQIIHLLLLETSTLGVRHYTVEKTTLIRDQSIVNTSWGPVRIKHGYLDGKCIKTKPEYEDCLKIAMENNIPLSQVYSDISILINIKKND